MSFRTGDPVQIGGARLTANIFPVLGVSPLMGRGFTQREDDSRAPVTVLSYQMWQSRFHGERKHTWPEDSAGPQALRGHRGDAA